MEDLGASTLGSAMTKVSFVLPRQSWRNWSLGIVVVLLLAFSAQRSLAWRNQDRVLGDGNAAAAAARAEVNGLVAINGSSSGPSIDRLLAGATAQFRTDLAAQAASLRKVLARNKVLATGEVVSTGVVTSANDRATVIVAAVGSVRNQRSRTAEPRNYRLKVELQKVGGQWLVSGLEFVA